MAKQRPRDPVQFTRESAERVANVVRTAEVTPLPASPLTFDRLAVPANRKVFRVCTFTGAWAKNTQKTVTFRGVASTPNTAVAHNIFVNVSGSSASKNCAIAKDGTAWYLIAAEC